MARVTNNPYKPIAKEDLHKPVLFVVDMVNGFVKEGALADPAIQSCIAPIRSLIEEVQPIVWFVNDSHEADAAEFAYFPPHCIKGTKEAEVVDELKDYVENVIEKNAISAASSKQFADMLETLEEEADLIVTGCCTDLCVLQLALPLRSWLNENNRKNSRVIVPLNCVETYDAKGVHGAEFWNEAALANLKANGIDVVDSIQPVIGKEQ